MRRTLFEEGGLAVTVAEFAPGEVQARHVDACSRITFLLRGALAEETRTGGAVLQAGSLLFKSNDVAHEDRVSPQGAAAVSLVFSDDDAFAGRNLWRPARTARGLRAVAAALDAAICGQAAGLKAAAADLVAEAAESTAALRAPPPWLARLKRDLEAAGFTGVDVSARAAEAGCHPVTASRLFRAAYGASITDHAQLHAVRRAQDGLAGETPLCAVALGAGFYDQSHMNRVFRRVTGATPGAWRRLSRAALAG